MEVLDTLWPFPPHPDKELLKNLTVREYQDLATKHGIKDIFQDNGGKILEIVLTLGLTVLPGRQGNDFVDPNDKEYEGKTVNINNKNHGANISTNHHLTPPILAKYRLADWLIAIYSNIDLMSIYWLTPNTLEPYFAKWEEKLKTKDHLNCPPIHLKFVMTNGRLIYGSPHMN